MRIGHGFDAHRLVPGRKLILGGVDVPHETGALGHSDADVLAHAVSDAILGAGALGDLGTYFPDTSEQWKDADSLELLAQCSSILHREGYRIENLDATIVVQRPRLSPYIAQMRENIAARLGLTVRHVSIKAKTSEGLGYTGDGTGIAAFAVALITDVD
ncbi:MAG TPA: 2-C-methyl-D-erythritol 2,4-cyclodiphosphate synthase [Candidatus Baltobacteraceae bacterium]|jgi:2-C-methyl-D-erythritol 2,4-cyclodiphosphate synthase|nr:2-C-methyl-D-erythritol 2,4-cyclodiphosphate synthase [Candidatus Baltobacteraceae bacterium]